MAPDPFVPVVSTPVKLITVMEAETFCARFAVTDALLKGAAAKARHISDVPRWLFVLTTRAHVKPAPDTLLTVIVFPE
jgi:hypothetical protein